MTPALWLSLALLILLVGGGAIWLASRRSPTGGALPPVPGVADMGYGVERWERELTLWRGVLRRLEIQARHQTPPSPRLQQELDEARARIAEAERHLGR